MAELQVKKYEDLTEDEKKQYGAVIAGTTPEFTIWVGKTKEKLRGFPLTEDMIPLHIVSNVINHIKQKAGGEPEKFIEYYDPKFVAETIGSILRVHYPDEVKSEKSLTQLMTPAQVKEGLHTIFNTIFSGSNLGATAKDFFSKLTPLMSLLSQPGGEQMLQLFPVLIQEMADRVEKIEEKLKTLTVPKQKSSSSGAASKTSAGS